MIEYRNQIAFSKPEKLETDSSIHYVQINILYKLIKLINDYFNKLGVLHFNKTLKMNKPTLIKQNNSNKIVLPSKTKSDSILSKLVCEDAYKPKKDISIDKLMFDLMNSKEKIRVKFVLKRFLV